MAFVPRIEDVAFRVRNGQPGGCPASLSPAGPTRARLLGAGHSVRGGRSAVKRAIHRADPASQTGVVLEGERRRKCSYAVNTSPPSSALSTRHRITPMQHRAPVQSRTAVLVWNNVQLTGG